MVSHTAPFFTVVVPTYNRADLISTTLASLQNQNYDNYEIIIVDDGSTDNTSLVVQPFLNDRTVYVKKENSERAASRNFGARLAKGDYVNFFDSDDVALPNHLSEAAKLIKQHLEAQWFHIGYAWATPNQKIFKQVNNFKGETLNSIMHFGNSLSCNGVFVRKDIILSNPFNESRDLSASEDYELWLRLSARYPLLYSNEITSLVIDHDFRSVRKTSLDKLEKRVNLLLLCLQEDQFVTSYFGKRLSEIKTDLLSYVSLHTAHEKRHKVKSFDYLLRTLSINPKFIFRRRFYAILKKLVIGWEM